MNTFTIARKELSSYFRSPIAYGVMCFFALITGFFLLRRRFVFPAAEPASDHDGPVRAAQRE